jgi:hypothetical protein
MSAKAGGELADEHGSGSDVGEGAVLQCQRRTNVSAKGEIYRDVYT